MGIPKTLLEMTWSHLERYKSHSDLKTHISCVSLKRLRRYLTITLVGSHVWGVQRHQKFDLGGTERSSPRSLIFN